MLIDPSVAVTITVARRLNSSLTILSGSPLRVFVVKFAVFALFLDALHSLDSYFNERDDALAQGFPFKAVIGHNATRRSFQNAVLVDARLPRHTRAR